MTYHHRIRSSMPSLGSLWELLPAFWRRLTGTIILLLLLPSLGRAQDRSVIFDTSAAGVTKSIASWGLDTAWLSSDNVRRGVRFMGAPQVDVIRFSFTGDWPLVSGALGTSALAEFNDRMNIVNAYTDSHTALYLNNDTGTYDASFIGADGRIEPVAWATLINVTKQQCVSAGRTVLSVAPYNEPDNSTEQGSVTRLGDVCWQLRNTFGGNFSGVQIYGASTLNDDNAATWYNTLNGWGYLEAGNTHQLAGTFDNYAAFYQTIQANGDLGVNDELHNVMEAMVGAEYGMQVGIWWGTAERARGEFVKASDGKRLGYAEHRANWTAASVYRGPSGSVQAFVGESERQALPTTYRFFAKDRDVFYDGQGPQRAYAVTTTGASGYQTSSHHNAEKVVNITWGADVQPAVNGRYLIVNRNSGKVMEVAGASTNNGANIQQNTYSGGLNQQWDVVPVPNTTGGDYSYFTVRAAHSGKAADLYNFSLDDGGNIAQWDSAVGVNQQYYLQYVSNGWFTVQSKWSTKCLDVAGGATTDGANIQQWASTGGLNQQWRLIPVGAAIEFVAPAAPAGVAASANAASVRLTWTANTEADLAGYTVLRATTSGGPYEIVARGLTTTTFTDKSANKPVAYYYVVAATDQSLNRSAYSSQVSATPTAAATLLARYSFDNTASDSTTNANHAELVGSPSYAAGKFNQALSLNGSSQYVLVPAGIMAAATNFTIASWVYWNGSSQWQRIFDFGNGTSQYMFLTPNSGSGTLRFGITTNGGGAEQIVQTASALPTAQWIHVAVTYNGTTAIIYTNGVLAASGAVTISPAAFNPAINNLGASQYADPYFNGLLDDVCIYNYALTATQVGALMGLPSPWVTTDIGAVAAAGSASYSSGTFTVIGSGADIWGTADEFRYVYQTASGACEMRARVATVGNTDVWAKSGVMVRESTAAGSRFAAVYITPSSGVSFQWRATTGGSCSQTTVTGITAPRYVRLVRSASNGFTAYYSANGSTWTQVGTSQTISMATSVTMGLAVTSHNDGTLCTSTLDTITATP